MATSNENIRDLINNLRLEMKGDLGKVSDKVDNIDGKVNNLTTAQAVSTTKISMIVAGISIVVSALVSLLLRRIG